MQFNCKMGYSGNEQDYQLIKTSISELKKSNNQKDLLRYLTNVLPNPTDVVTLDNAQDTVKSVKAQLANKNLLPPADSGTYYQGTIAGGNPLIYNNATVISSFNNIDVSEYKGIYTVIKLTEGETYTLTINNLVNNCATKQIKLAVGFRSSESTIFGTSEKENATVSPYYNLPSLTFTVPSGYPYCLVGFYNYPTVAGDTVSFNAMQLEIGTTATAYTPYISDFSTVKVNTYGKNFIDINSIANDIVEKNPTSCEITDFDGKRCLKIGATSTIKYTIQTLIPLYGLQLKVYSTGYTAGFMGYTKNDTGTSVTYITVSNQNEWVNIKRYYPAASQYYTGIQFYKTDASKPVYIDLDSVMLEASHKATEYEPYKGSEYTPSADGTVKGITVLTPTTNIINDKGLLFTKVIGDDFNYIN